MAVLLPRQEVAAQIAASATLSGVVVDPTGAVIPDADVHLTGPAGDLELHTDNVGRFTFKVAPGTYTLQVDAPDFERFKATALELRPDAQTRLPVHLLVAGRAEEISVGTGPGSAPGASTDPSANGSQMVFEGDSLKMLSDDDATLQQQLTAMAGPSLGGAPTQFLVNGFSGGKLPPKTSIRSIRINQNPYSAANDSPGFGRVDIETKPGGDKFHGALNFAGSDQPFNARNPYDFGTLPPYYEFKTDGNLNGPINKKTSFFLSENVQLLANNAVVNAINPADTSQTLSEAVPAPQHTYTFSARVDRQFGPNNFAFLRDEWTQNHLDNSGINPLMLPEAAFASNTLTNTLQGSDTQVFGPHLVNEARFQYIRTRIRQDPNSAAPAVVVQGAFQSGGNPIQTLRDNQDHLELQDLLDFDRGTHAVRAGFRLRELRDANFSRSNFNGQFIFPSLAAYQAAQPSQFNITIGQPSALLWSDDIGVFAEDDWKASKNLTVSYGFRFESESAIPDHSDPSARLGLAWAVHRGKKPMPLVTLRVGYGTFYDRFPAANLLQAIRQNGSSEIAYFVQNPGYPDIPSLPTLNASQPTIYRVNPELKSSYTQIGSIGVDRVIGRKGTLSSMLLFAHGTHGFLSQNINAPLPGTYNPADLNSGVRPFGGTGNIYQYNSDSNENDEVWFTNTSLRLTSHLSMFAAYVLQSQNNEGSGSTSFPSNQYNVKADYGPATGNFSNVFNGALLVSLPHGIQLTTFGLAHTGAPFDITTGTDLNGDTIYNDRPAFATDLTRSSVVRTPWGNFDSDPLPTQQIIPRNYGRAPGYVWLDVQAAKSFQLGPRPRAAAAPADTKAGPPVKTERPWTLMFQVEAQNVFNHNNPGLPIGVLPSPGEPICSAIVTTISCSYFGRSLSLASDFNPLTTSNRTILLQSFFSF